MDERHWWIANKVMESFSLGGKQASPTVLEELFLQSDNLQLLNDFLKANGLCKLFFCANVGEKRELIISDLHIRPSLLNLQEFGDQGNVVVLYFLRRKVDREVDPVRMEQDLFCGEIKDNPVENLSCLLSDLFVPLLRAQKDWGHCSEENISHFLAGLDKHVAALQDSAYGAKAEKQQRPMKLVSPDVIQQRSAIFDPDVISENEALVSDWIKTIEQVLLEAASDRVLDLNATPLTELDHWRRRQKILGSITEQLKGKECKMVIGLLISTKSRLLKKWKAVDISITDAANSTKDRVKYLEALRRHFDYLASENNPVVLINTVLPGLFNGIKQMEIISRFYSRAGYLGLLLTKVSNQLALGCRDFLKEAAMANGCEDKLWEVVERDIEEKELIPFQPLIQKKQKREKDPEIVLRTGTFYDRIQSCLALHTYFQDAVRQLREELGGSCRFSSNSSLSTVQGKLPSSTTVKSSKINLKKTSSVTSGFDHHHDIQGTKVSIMDEDTILYHLDTLCRRIRQFADVITTLHQYNNLRQQIEGIRKPCQEDLVEDDWSETGSINETTGPEDYIDCMKKEAVFFHAEPYHSGVITGMLQTLVEEDEVQSATGGSSVVPCQQQQTHEDSNEQPTEHQQLQLLKQYKDDENEEKDHRLSNEEKQMLHNLYNWEDPDDDGSALSSVVLENLKQMIDTMSLTIDIALLLDMERREHSPFEEVYYDFLVMNQQLEMYLSVYIQALFLRRMQTQEALSILKRFSNVSHRQGIQPMINECYMEAFDWFLDELKEVQEIYETNKDDPVVPKNISPIAGAISWSRQLLSRIESTMKVFREVRIVTSSYSYVHTVKLYNRVAAALVAYETLQYKKWKTQMNSGLSGLSITLLVRNPVTKELVVNADQRIVELIEEAKWMVRLGIRVPETALLASRQEKKFKLYRSHLEDVLQEYQQVQRKIPDCLGLLFKVHLRAVDHQIQPGLYGLTWNSVNIEAFLHQTYTAVSRLKSLTEKATEIKENIIDKILDEITNLVQFDIDDVRTEPKCPSEFLELMSVSMNNRKTELECMVAAIKTSVTDIVSIAKYFCDQAYKAVFASICRSLLTLAQVSGCNMEAITKMAINLSEESKSSSSPSLSSSVPGTYSRASAVSRASRSYSVMSTLSEMEESLVCDPQALRCKLKLRLKIPNIVVDPPLEAAQDVLKQTAAAVLHSSDSISWWVGELKGDSFFSSIAEDEAIQYILSHIDEVVKNVKPAVEKHVFHLSYYDFLWKNDLNGQCDELTTANPELFVINKEVERLLKTQQKIQDIPEILDIGCICLDLSLIKDTLKGFAGVWKFKYASVLHQDAKEKLEAVVKYRNEVNQNLTVEVQTLEQLNSSLNLLEELCDMENKIDETYLPIETAYEQLRSYKLRIPREEVREVQHLRDNWADLMTLAEKVRENLLKEKQDTFKQELDKQIKSFVVEVIQLRNSFDNQGPAAPGVRPEEAVQRLRDFEQKFQAYDAKRKTLNSVQRLFGMIPKAFPELDKTGKDLMLLSTLYELFQTFIGFDQRFRDTLWADVDLQQNNRMVEEYWSECQTWNEKLKNWDAYNEMAEHIKFYVDCFPVLHKLAAKEIRNRHWLQVMGVTGSSFPLEANVFKLHHLLDIPLLKHKEEIFSITGAAAKELELEVKMRRVEEEWTEQVLHFETYKKRGHILLAKADSNYLLEQLEDVRVLLAQMLTNRHIGPLREEATSWAEKLKRVSEVLEVWIEVQNLWQHLDAAFSKPTIIKCCCAGDILKEVALKHMFEALEVCSRSLTSYLDRTRQAFPRFYFLSDLVLLSVLSHPNDLESLQHHLGSIFSGICNIKIEKTACEEKASSVAEPDETYFVPDFRSVCSGNDGFLSVGQRSITQMTDSDIILQRSQKSCITLWANSYDEISVSAQAGVSQEGLYPAVSVEPDRALIAVAVMAPDGETLQLNEEVSVISGVEVWLKDLQESIHRTLESKIYKVACDVDQGVTIDEWTYRYPAQVARLGLLYCWTKDCEAAISDLKVDCKALPGAVKKHSGMIYRLSAIVSKGSWKHTEESVSQYHRLKLENILMYGLYLRDLMEGLSILKVHELTDFDWRRGIRLYVQEKDGLSSHTLCILDAQYQYGCEFYGAKVPLMLNPTTEKCFLAVSRTVQKISGVTVQGDQGIGKTENIKDGCWSCFDDFHLLTKDVVSVLVASTQAIFDAMKANRPACFMLDGQEVELNRNFNLFLTVYWKSDIKKLPSDVRAIFRTVSLTAPDYTVLLKGKLSALGFKYPKVLANRLQLVTELVTEQLPQKYHSCFGLQTLWSVINWAAQKRLTEKEGKPGRKMDRLEDRNGGGKTSRSSSVTSVRHLMTSGTSPCQSQKTSYSIDKNRKSEASTLMTTAAKAGHSVIAEGLQEVVGPRMIVRDVFGETYEPSDVKQLHHNNLEKAIVVKAQENNLIPHSPWMDKVRQLYSLSQVHHGMFVAGPPGSGKSTCISTLVHALSLLSINQQQEASGSPEGAVTHKLVKINPFTVDDFSLLFGHQTSSHSWVDGVITYAWKKAIRYGLSMERILIMIPTACNKNHSNNWICFDGPLSSSWADSFSSMLGQEKVLQLNNGDQLHLKENMKLLFETSELGLASPATIAKAGILFMEGDGLGWRPLAEAWLEKRNQQENAVLSKAFQKTLDPIFQYVLHDAKSLVPVTEVGLFQTCSNLLGAMLDDKAQSIGGQLHIERLFLFCLIWTVGGLLESTEKKKFNNILKTTTSVLPDYEHEVSVFDYFVDESGEWEHWESRLPETAYLGCTDILGEVFVETVDTMIVRMLMEYSSICSQNVLLIGPPGSGKTAMINDFISTQDNSHIVIKRMVFSRASKAKDLQQMIEQNIVHRQGFIYGAKDGKAFQIFLDDLNLPHSDENGVHPCDELLRQLLDDKVLLKFSKPFEVQKLEGLVVQAAMSLTEYPSNPYRTISQRLLRHFAVLTLVAPEGCNLQKVIFSILEANMGSRARESLTQEVHESIALASSNLLKAVKKVLIPSSTPGRQHYVFSLRDITKALQCLQKLSSEDQGDTAMVFSFWHQEIQRILGDRLCRQADLKWFNNEVTQLIKENFPEVQFDALRKQFVTFPLEMIFSHQTAAGNSQKGIKVTLQPISQVDEVQSCLQTYLKHYNEELGNQKLAIELSKNLTAYVVRIHRVLTYEHGGNVLLIGTVGSHLRSLVKLALYIAGVLIHPMDTSEKSNFFNSLKSAIQQSGVEGKHTAILLTGRELVDDMYLDAINSLLTCGEYPPLYSTEEMNDLLQVLIPTLRRDHPHLMNNPMKYFVSRVKSNLHVILCLPPNHELLSIASIEKVSKAMTTIHNHVLKEHRQISWVGHCDDIISFNNTTLQRNEKSGKETLMIEKVDVPNLPYSKEIIKERISLLNRQEQKTASKNKDPKSKMDKVKWKMLQNSIGDSGKFIEMIHNVAKSENGLPDEVLKEVESYLRKPKESYQGVTGEGSLLGNAAPYATLQSITAAKKFSAGEKGQTRHVGKAAITIASARYSSEDAATLVAFVVALVEYTRLCAPLKFCHKRLQELERKKEDYDLKEQEKIKNVDSEKEELLIPEQSKLVLSADDLPALQMEVEQLQAQYDVAVVHKHELEAELHSHQERLKASQNVALPKRAKPLVPLKREESVDTSNTRYARERPLLYGGSCKLQIKELELKELPMNKDALDNSCAITNEECNDAWIFLCDPTAQAINWIKSHFATRFVEVKYHVDDHEVECHPHFRLYLHSSSFPQEVPAEIAAFCSLLYFQQDHKGITEELLNHFIKQEKPRLYEEHRNLQQECLETMTELWNLDMKMIQTLSSDDSLINNLNINKRLSVLKQQYDEALEEKSRIDSFEKTLFNAREGFRAIAERGALMLDTAQAMRQLNNLYHTSFRQLLELFDISVAHSERSSVKQVIAGLTQNIFSHVSKFLLEKDRMVYTLLVAFEILATYFSWFWDLFDRMYKDGKEMTWKTFCESEQPENPTKARWPDGMADLSPLQCFLILRAVRSDRFLQAASVFIGSTLGKIYTSGISTDLQSWFVPLSPQVPSLLIYSIDSEIPRKLFLDFSNKRKRKVVTFSVSNSGMAEKRRVKQVIAQGMVEGYWVLLENIHNSEYLMMSLEKILQENRHSDKNFHLWVSAQASPQLPVSLLHFAVKMVVDTPMTMRDGLMRCLQWVDSESLWSGTHPDWLAVVHNLCFLHCAVRLRAQYGNTTGWNYSNMMMFENRELMEALQLLSDEFNNGDPQNGGRSISWTNLRYLLSEVVYGSNVKDESDKTSLAAMVDYWISPCTTKKDCELTKLKYKIPAAFFAPNARLSSVLQALDAIPQYSLDVPEAFSMNSTSDIPFGEHNYVLTRLKCLYDSMTQPSNEKHTPTQKPQITQKRLSALTTISTVSDHPPVALQGTYSQYPNNLTKPSKETELWEICGNLLSKLPKGWSKDAINDRLKKLGGNTLFNLFIKNELDHLMALLAEVKRNLQAIKGAAESVNTLGDQLSATVLSVASDLYHSRSPRHWCQLAGDVSPPPDWPASSWIGELQQRVVHFEKILQLFSTLKQAASAILAGMGRERMPTYWLGAFKNPKGLLSALKQEAVHQQSERTSSAEPLVFQTEITQRDKDHSLEMRDPPQDGMFVYGVHVWGVTWHKTEAELLDSPHKQSPATLPVIHLHCLPVSDKGGPSDLPKMSDMYRCPVYISTRSPREPVLYLNIHKDNIPAFRWALRGMKATLHPF
nr:PREDICTED: dynein heavy chain 8, axonemal-like [Latimeria chalumnae]|eukprot:XP_014351636.1 PREDICTED: dynein heavy chain 8, axonemal-like [Latimeria chalumnae]